MSSSFLFLGTGASVGIPMLTCHCAVCTSKDPKNQRLRPSGLLKLGEKRFLIDPGPDFRQQGLKFGIDRLDGVLITHMHYDHIAGFNDLRVYYFLQKRLLPCLLSRESYAEMKIRNHYLFEKTEDDVLEGPKVQFQVIEKDFGEEFFEGEKWRILSFEQGEMKVTGFRWRNFAYVMDLKKYSAEIFTALKGVEVLVMSGLRYHSSPAHLNLGEACAFAAEVGAKQTWFSHISHSLAHEQTNRHLPPGIKLAYDGLEIDLLRN